MKKKIFNLILSGIIVLGLTGCEEKTTTNNNDENTENTSIRINLNENIEVYENMYSTLCGGWYFVTNAEEVFPGGIEETTNYKVIPVGGAVIGPADWGEKFDELTFDESKEKEAEAKFNKIDATNILGISKYKSSFNNHEFYYEYYALELRYPENYTEINNELQTSHTEFKNTFNSIFAKTGAYLKKGPCGDGYSEPIVLTEELCETYNLNCDRW